MHVGRNHERRRQRPIDAILYLETFCINGCKKISLYYGSIQRTSHAILFVDDGTIIIINKSASCEFEIGRVLKHRWIQRRVAPIEEFRGSGSDAALLCSMLMSFVQNMAVCVHYGT